MIFFFFTRNDDLPPEAPDDQPMPKTLSRLLRSGQQITQTSRQRKKTNSQEHTLSPGKESTGLGRKRKKRPVEQTVDAKGGSVKDEREPLFKRERGESLKAYLERIDVESNARIMEAYRRSRKQSNRRKRCVRAEIVVKPLIQTTF